ncbi:MAG: hypothetical protein HPY76_08885 [Anaerolineae bacterium]|nr:hypothetical protein [Anaerolineae bacterium]
MQTLSHPRNNSLAILEKALAALLMGIAGFVVLASAAIVIFQLWYLGRIFPGVSVAGIPVAGLKPAEATTRLASQLVFPQDGKLLLQSGERTWLLSPSELGLYLDPSNSAAQAFRVGRDGSLAQRLQYQLDALTGGVDVAPLLIHDQRQTAIVLSQIAGEIELPMLDPTITIQGTDVVVTPGQVGLRVDQDATISSIMKQMQSLQDGVIPLATYQVVPEVVDVEAQAELARQILSLPLILTLPEGQPEPHGPWTFEPDTLARMLAFERVQTDGTTRYQVTIDSSQLRVFLNELEPELYLQPEDPRFIFNDDTRELEVIQPAVIGRTLKIEESIDAIQKELLQGGHVTELTLALTPPDISDNVTGAELGITELVYSEYSYFYGSSSERVQNITASAQRFHGLLVAPGETFSMADALGNISLENGYAEALIIVGDQTVKGVGGGVCQVSTTLFRTAFFAGFPIVERHAHAYRVYYYEKVSGNSINSQLAGLDATVFVPLVDFKFTNDTPNWLLMETYVNPSYSSIQWKFYSTSDGRTVEWQTTGLQNVVQAPPTEYRENPELANGEVNQVDWEADGADVTVTRQVYRDGSLLYDDTFQTHYQPWQAVYEYGPGTEGMPPDETPVDGNEEE